MGADGILYEPLECGDIVVEFGRDTSINRRHQYTALEEQIAHTSVGGGAYR